MRFALWSVYLAIRNFTFFKYCYLCKNSSLKGISYSLIFVFREKEIFTSVIRDFFRRFVNRARETGAPVRPSYKLDTFLFVILTDDADCVDFTPVKREFKTYLLVRQSKMARTGGLCTDSYAQH